MAAVIPSCSLVNNGVALKGEVSLSILAKFITLTFYAMLLKSANEPRESQLSNILQMIFSVENKGV